MPQSAPLMILTSWKSLFIGFLCLCLWAHEAVCFRATNRVALSVSSTPAAQQHRPQYRHQQHSSLLSKTALRSTAADEGNRESSSRANMPAAASELSRTMDDMLLSDRYNFLIQSCESSMAEAPDTVNVTMLEKVNSLYSEMCNSRMMPSIKSTEALINAAAPFCESNRVGFALQLGTAAGVLKKFGSYISSLSTPAVSKIVAAGLLPYPKDSRQKEVTYAAAAAASVALYGLLETFSWTDDDFRPWMGTCRIAIVAAIMADVAMRDSKAIKTIMAGFDRLFNRDHNRQAYCDGASFTAGYLLGLPCFCFQSDVTVVVYMLGKCTRALQVYSQQPTIPVPTYNQLLEEVTAVVADEQQPSLGPDSTDRNLQTLGRVLVWLMAPAAAEMLKYGRTIVTDPKKAERLLTVLQYLGENGEEPAVSSLRRYSSLYQNAEQREALLNWAYHEAKQLMEDNVDLVEDMCKYLRLGTSSVGECCMKIEDKQSD